VTLAVCTSRWSLSACALAVVLSSTHAVADSLDTAPSDAEVAALAARLRAPDLPQREEAARAILALGPDAVPALMARLVRRRVPTPAALWNALQRVMPSRMTDEEKERFDPLPPLLRASREDGWAAATSEVTEAIVVIRALGKSHTLEGLTAIIQFMPRERQTFRREVAHALLDAGAWALPALIRGKRTGGDEDLKRFCRRLIADLGFAAPADAVQQNDNELLSSILLAWGDTRDPQAMNVVASFVNSEREIVRDAARRAIAQYDGNEIWALRQAYENFEGREPPNDWNVERTARELYALYDQRRTRDADVFMAQGLKAAQDGKPDEMLRAFDRVLAIAPRYGRRKDMVPGLLARAEELLRAGDHDDEAIALLRKAHRLDPEGSHARRIGAHLAYLDGRQWMDRGLLDRAPFEQALALDPQHPLAREAVTEIDGVARGERRVRKLPLQIGISLGVVAITALLWLLRRRKPPVPVEQT
jgi:tetratricopeptide (TPR) repeat protein